MSGEAEALGFFARMAQLVAEVDRKIATVSAHRERLITQRDRKHEQIALTEREWRMYQNKIDAAEAQLLLLARERARLFGSPVKAPFRNEEST